MARREREEPIEEPDGPVAEPDEELDLDDELDLDEELDLDDELVDIDEDLEDLDVEEVDVDDLDVADDEVVSDVDVELVDDETAEGDGLVEDDDDEEELEDDDEVESALDEILRERFVGSDLDGDVEVESEDDSGDGIAPVRPRQPGEFVCQSCFLVKSMSQLADPDKMVCRDCL